MHVKSANTEVELSESTLIAGVMGDLSPLPGSEEAVGSVDASIFEVSGFKGKTGEILTVPHHGATALRLVGVGDDVSFESLRAASGNAVRGLKTARVVTLLALADIAGATRAVVEGSVLGAYRYRSYRTEETEEDIDTMELIGGDEEAINEALILAEATNLARDWVNTPARDKSPETLAGLMDTAATAAGLATEVWDRGRIEKAGLGGVLGVAAGSDRDPRVVILTYSPEGATRHLALVGKGITFDSGGLSIKPSGSMEEMKDDMAGGAAVAAAVIAIARLGLTVRVTCIVPMTDNAVGGNATRPGDVLTPMTGPTIEVLNTDAEGRLILADGLGLALGAEPDFVVDMATLTGAARVALGDKIAAVFGSDRDVAGQVLGAASRAGEEFWEMPLFKDYRSLLDSNIADIKNISGSRYGGAIVAALFLAEYAGDGRWAHLDIAGPARSRETAGESVKGASGIGVRTLVELARGMSEPA